MSKTRDNDEAQDLIRRLNGCKAVAHRLGYAFLADLLSAAILEAAMQSISACDVLSNPERRLEQLIQIKLAIALGQASANVVALHQSKRNESNRHDPDDAR
jgi:hypothetical protein